MKELHESIRVRIRDMGLEAAVRRVVVETDRDDIVIERNEQ